MRNYTLIGKLDVSEDTFFSGKAATDVTNDENFNHHFSKHEFVAEVPVEDFIDVYGALVSGGLCIEYVEDADAAEAAQKYWENI